LERISHAVFAYSTPLAGSAAGRQRRDDAMQTIRAEGIDNSQVGEAAATRLNRAGWRFTATIDLDFHCAFAIAKLRAGAPAN